MNFHVMNFLTYLCDSIKKRVHDSRSPTTLGPVEWPRYCSELLGICTSDQAKTAQPDHLIPGQVGDYLP